MPLEVSACKAQKEDPEERNDLLPVFSHLYVSYHLDVYWLAMWYSDSEPKLIQLRLTS